MAGSCEHDNESSDFIKVWEFLNQFSDYEILKKDTVPWSMVTRLLRTF